MRTNHSLIPSPQNRSSLLGRWAHIYHHQVLANFCPIRTAIKISRPVSLVDGQNLHRTHVYFVLIAVLHLRALVTLPSYWPHLGSTLERHSGWIRGIDKYLSGELCYNALQAECSWFSLPVTSRSRNTVARLSTFVPHTSHRFRYSTPGNDRFSGDFCCLNL